MSELREPHRPISYVHVPIDYDSHLPDPRDRTLEATRQSQTSSHMWTYTSQQNPLDLPPPPRPLPVPTQREVVKLDDPDQDDEEYMNIDPSGPDVEPVRWMGGQRMGSPSSSKRKEAGSNFVGGFVSGLRRFPRVVMRSYGYERRKRVRRGTSGTADTGDTGGTSVTTLPKYESSPERSGTNNIQYVQATEMPVEHPAPAPLGYQRPPSHDLEDLYEATHEGVSTTRHSTMRRSTALHSNTHPSSARHTMLQEESVPAPLDMLVPEATHDGGLDSPVLVEPKPSSDYAKMGGPNVHIPTETSSFSRVFGLRQFLRSLRDLPWVSSRVTADYIPGQHLSGHSRGHKKASTSWYARPQPPSVDFSPRGSRPTSASPRARRRHTRSSTASHPASPYPYPYPTSPADSRAPRRKRTRRSTNDGTRSRSSNGHGNAPFYPHGYVPYSYNYAPQPQPLYVMHPSSQQASPTGTNVLPGYAEMRQAVPIYVVTPPPGGQDQLHGSAGSPHSQYPSFPMPMPTVPRAAAP